MNQFWPRVAESETEFNRRRNALKNRRLRDNESARSHAKAGVR